MSASHRINECGHTRRRYHAKGMCHACYNAVAYVARAETCPAGTWRNGPTYGERLRDGFRLMGGE